jgi:hypothetical protein
VRWTGRRIIKGVARFMANQTEVSDSPVLDRTLFSFIAPIDEAAG